MSHAAASTPGRTDRATASESVVHRQCTLCEAHCGIEVRVANEEILDIRGDRSDPISKGHICPKATALADLHIDPDRLTRPVVRSGDGWQQVSWDEALTTAAAGLNRVRQRHGPAAIGNYFGNPAVHNAGLYNFLLFRLALGTPNNFSAASLDSAPQLYVAQQMFGSPTLLPIPDLERTDHVLILGANPAVSNGSVMSSPGVRTMLKEVIARGGRVTVVDPRRTETAVLAGDHVSIRPGGDPYLLLGMLHDLFAAGTVDLGRLSPFVDGLDRIAELVEPWDVERAGRAAGVQPATVARLAAEFGAARTAAAYGRAGLCHHTTGSLAHWLLNVLNIVTGNLDAPGGAMFPTSALNLNVTMRLILRSGLLAPKQTRQRATGHPACVGEFPAAGMADEILTPGPGQIRAMLVHAGNPVLSSPDGTRLERALERLEWMVAIDPYINETTRHADVILPPISLLARADLDIFGFQGTRNRIRYSPAAVAAPPDALDDDEIITQLMRRIRGVRARLFGVLTRTPLADGHRVMGLLVATGPYGLRRGLRKGLTLGRIKRAPHGLDLGPLDRTLPGALATRDRRIRLAPDGLVAAAEVLSDDHGSEVAPYDLRLIGRRQVRGMNSWLHNSSRLMKGEDRCTLLLHPTDAAARGLAAGDLARVTSRVGAIELPLEISEEMRPGVGSIPHGFGHHRPDVGWRLAASKPGVSVNDITDASLVDALSGNAAFNSLRVRIEPVGSP